MKKLENPQKMFNNKIKQEELFIFLEEVLELVGKMISKKILDDLAINKSDEHDPPKRRNCTNDIALMHNYINYIVLSQRKLKNHKYFEIKQQSRFFELHKRQFVYVKCCSCLTFLDSLKAAKFKVAH